MTTKTVAVGGAFFTPPEVAKQLGVYPSKIVAWIHSGELAAVNVVQNLGCKPRFRITQTALDDFLKRRAAVPPPPPPATPRRRKQHAPKEYIR